MDRAELRLKFFEEVCYAIKEFMPVVIGSVCLIPEDGKTGSYRVPECIDIAIHPTIYLRDVIMKLQDISSRNDWINYVETSTYSEDEATEWFKLGAEGYTAGVNLYHTSTWRIGARWSGRLRVQVADDIYMISRKLVEFQNELRDSEKRVQDVNDICTYLFNCRAQGTTPEAGVFSSELKYQGNDSWVLKLNIDAYRKDPLFARCDWDTVEKFVEQLQEDIRRHYLELSR